MDDVKINWFLDSSRSSKNLSAFVLTRSTWDVFLLSEKAEELVLVCVFFCWKKFLKKLCCFVNPMGSCSLSSGSFQSQLQPSLSRIFDTVDQLKRASVGNPNTGSMLLSRNFFVVGSLGYPLPRSKIFKFKLSDSG